MIWQAEWKAISDRVHGLLEAGQFYVACQSQRGEDPVGINKVLEAQAQEVFTDLVAFGKTHQDALPPPAAMSLKTFLDRAQGWFFPSQNAAAEYSIVRQRHPHGIVQLQLTALSSFRSEFMYRISDFTAIAKRLSERAFVHLQRSIVADPSIQECWQAAFKDTRHGEPRCEKLGGAHLLLHGIWAFKANAAGERTDLVLGEPLMDLSQVEKAAEALVLTEWKVVRKGDKPEAKIEEACKQADLYKRGSLAGIELAQYGYLVMVSQDYLEMKSELSRETLTYRLINIAVNPPNPSYASRSRRGDTDK